MIQMTEDRGQRTDGRQRMTDGRDQRANRIGLRAQCSKLKAQRNEAWYELSQIEVGTIRYRKAGKKKPWNSRDYLSSSNTLADVRIWKAVAEFQGKLWIG